MATNSFCVGQVSDASSNPLYKTCSPRGGNCNPTGTSPRCADNAPADRRSPAFACYIVSPDHADETVCECAGTVPEGQRVRADLRVRPGQRVHPRSAPDVRCRRLCTPLLSPLTPVVHMRPGTQSCRAFPGTRRVGYCL